MGKLNPAETAVLSFGLILAALPASAYYANCNGEFTASNITSVFGEARPTSSPDGTPFDPTRFHTGTDIADCGAEANVGAIEAGVFAAAGNCVTGDCFTVTNATTGKVFFYVHIIPVTTLLGTTVQEGDVIGHIRPRTSTFAPHLHLGESQAGLSFFLNPQRPNALEFSDPAVPQFVSETMVGNISDSVIPVVAAQRILDTLLLTLRPSFRDYPACGAQASCA